MVRTGAGAGRRVGVAFGRGAAWTARWLGGAGGRLGRAAAGVGKPVVGGPATGTGAAFAQPVHNATNASTAYRFRGRNGTPAGPPG